MRVSVIIAAFNVDNLIARALASVRAQTLGDWEIIVVDDASTDATPGIVAAHAAADPRIRLVRQHQNRGPAAARNRGIAEASGEWIAILDADDAWRPERLERLLAVADRTGSDFVADNLILFDDHLRRETGTAFAFDDDVTVFSPAALFSRANPWDLGILKPVVRRGLLAKAGLRYDESLRFGEDFLLTAELLFRGARAALTGDGYYVYTTPVGHVSRRRASGSRSTTSLEALLRITDLLSERYGGLITSQIAAGIARCRRRVKQRLIAREITRLRADRSIPRLTAFLVGHPRGAVRYLVGSRTWSRAFGDRRAG